MVKELVALVGLAVPAGHAEHHIKPTHRAKYQRAYEAVAHKFGPRTPGRNIVKWGLASGKPASDTDVVRSTRVLQNMLAPPLAPPVTTTTTSTNTSAVTSTTSASVTTSPSGLANVPGVPSSFAACVALRESTNGTASSNVYGILGPGGQGSLAQQKQAFSQMYATRGVQPWQPYDGCTG